MKKCICVDKDKKSREALEEMILKIEWLQLVKTCANLDTALKICQTQDIDILFVRLYIHPVPEKKITLLERITNCKTQIVVLYSRIGIPREAMKININNFVNIPTTAKRLSNTGMQALKEMNPG